MGVVMKNLDTTCTLAKNQKMAAAKFTSLGQTELTLSHLTN
jgi:hypothetical protein